MRETTSTPQSHPPFELAAHYCSGPAAPCAACCRWPRLCGAAALVLPASCSVLPFLQRLPRSLIASPCRPRCMVAWGAAALQFWLLPCSAHDGTAALLRSSWLLLLPPSACSTGQLPPAATFPTSPGTCSESVRLTFSPSSCPFHLKLRDRRQLMPTKALV